jgi:choline-sulfatase
MVDAEIGRLYDALMNSRFAENTVVIFSSDHGDALGFHGKVNKSILEESSWRVPTIVVTPERHRKSQVDNEHLSIGVDLPATICDYAGVPPLPKMTIGTSLRPLVEGKPVKWRDHIVGENWNGMGRIGIRDATHKTIFYGEDGLVCVFDLAADPLEMNDLSVLPEGRAVLAKHKRYLSDYLGQIDIYIPPKPTEQQSAYKLYHSWYSKLREEARQ